jgi:hypothetical protein
MMGRFLGGLASLVLMLVCLGPGALAEEPSGAVYVTTLPSGADIWVDGTYVGRAPVLVDALEPGHHELTVTKTGWVVQEVDVVVPAGSVAMSSTHLAAGPKALAGSATGSIVLRSVPDGAELELDGVPFTPPVGKPMTVDAGPHRITLTLAHAKMTRLITVMPDTATDVVLRAPRTDEEVRSPVVAPAEDYLPTDNFSIEGKKIVVRYAGHVVVAYLGETQMRIDGSPIEYDGAPQSIGGKLYLPLALLEKLSDDMSNSK